MLWLGLNTQEPWISPHSTTHSGERGMKANDRRGERREGGLQDELKLRDINREKRCRRGAMEAGGWKTGRDKET